jgi:cytochrome c-type biogenesis protein CcmH
MKQSAKNILLAFLFVFVLSLMAGTALAQEPDPVQPPTGDEVTDDEVNTIAKQLYCPVCENVPLDVCGTKACADWRDEIRLMLNEGRSEGEIMTYFADRYGRRVLATPQIRGIDVVVWAAPILGVIAGIGVLIASLRRMAPETLTGTLAPEAAVSYGGLDPAYVRRVEDELSEYLGT